MYVCHFISRKDPLIISVYKEQTFFINRSHQSPVQNYRSLLSQISLQLAHVQIPDVNYVIIFQQSIEFKVIVLYMLK
jgi:hypothetical protein